MAEDLVSRWSEILYVSTKEGMRFAYLIYEWIRKEILDHNLIVEDKISEWEGFRVQISQ